MKYGSDQGKNCLDLFVWDMQQCLVHELMVLQSRIRGLYSTFWTSGSILFRLSKHEDGISGNTQYYFFPKLQIACVTSHLFLPLLEFSGP